MAIVGSTTRVFSSTLAHNFSASYGGGIFNHGTTFVTDSSIVFNTAEIDGGGIFTSINGALNLFNSSIFGNLPNNTN